MQDNSSVTGRAEFAAMPFEWYSRSQAFLAEMLRCPLDAEVRLESLTQSTRLHPFNCRRREQSAVEEMSLPEFVT